MTTLERDPVSDDAGAADPLDAVAAALRAHHIEVIVVDSGAKARATVLGLIPAGAEVHSGKSKTLKDLGLLASWWSPAATRRSGPAWSP